MQLTKQQQRLARSQLSTNQRQLPTREPQVEINQHESFPRRTRHTPTRTRTPAPARPFLRPTNCGRVERNRQILFAERCDGRDFCEGEVLFDAAGADEGLEDVDEGFGEGVECEAHFAENGDGGEGDGWGEGDAAPDCVVPEGDERDEEW